MAATLAAGALLAAAGSAPASYPGSNGRLVFAHYPSNGGQYDIFTMSPDGSDRVQLTDNPGQDLRPSYSADGERIVWAHRPQGMTNHQIWVMNQDGSGQTPVTTGVGTNDNEPMFSPDGERIVFERRTGSGANPQVFVMDADGSNPTQLTFPGPAGDESLEPQYSPDGSRIVFRRHIGGTARYEIWVMNADGSGQTPLTTVSGNTQDTQPSFSPDGRLIGWDRFTGPPPNEDIYVMNADGSGQRQVTSGPGQDYAPIFAPDMTRIVFERESQNFQYSDIILADPGGLDLGITPLTANAAPVYDSNPDWQPLNPPACDLSGNPKQKSVKSVSVTVTCANENATAVAEGSGSAPKAPKGATTSKKKRFTIPAVNQQVQPGTPTTITLTIPTKGRKALKRATKAGKKGKATITATLTDDLGQASTDTFQVTFKAKKKKEVGRRRAMPSAR